jgi:hypothetical protein
MLGGSRNAQTRFDELLTGIRPSGRVAAAEPSDPIHVRRRRHVAGEWCRESGKGAETISLIVWRLMMASCAHGCMGGILCAAGRGGTSMFARLHVQTRGVNSRIHYTGDPASLTQITSAVFPPIEPLTSSYSGRRYHPHSRRAWDRHQALQSRRDGPWRGSDHPERRQARQQWGSAGGHEWPRRPDV